MSRMDANQLQQIDATLSKYVSAVLGAAVTGLPSALGSTVPQVQLADSCSEVVRLQGLQLLVSLALVKPAAWIEIQCVTAIMSCIEKADHAYATAVNAGDDETAADNPLAAIKCALEYQRRRYRLLTAIVSQLEVSPVFDSLMAHLQQQFQSDTDALLAVSGSDSSSAADADRVAFILQHMQMLISTARDLIQRVKGVEDAQDTQVRGNESKVLRLLQCNGAAKGSQRNTSPLMQLLEGTMR